MTKEDVIIQGLQEEMKKANGIIQKQDKELEEAKEEIEELEVVSEAFGKKIEALQDKLAEKDGLIGKLKDELIGYDDRILFNLITRKNYIETMEFIIKNKGGRCGR